MSDAGPIVEPPEGAAERFAPPASPAAEPFWAATRERRLVLQWCRTCERAIHFPREACPSCLGVDLEFRKRFDQSRYEEDGQLVAEKLVDERLYVE